MPTHALVGRLVGDTPLSDGNRLADQFHTGRFVLLDRLDGALASVAGGWHDRVVTVVEHTYAAGCPQAYRSLTGLLVRPDGVVAWATDGDDADEAVAGLTSSLDRWAGRPVLGTGSDPRGRECRLLRVAGRPADSR